MSCLTTFTVRHFRVSTNHNMKPEILLKYKPGLCQWVKCAQDEVQDSFGQRTILNTSYRFQTSTTGVPSWV